MAYHLTVVRGRSSTQGLRIPEEGVTTVGRQNGCQIRIVSSQVSRKHCELYFENGRLVVKDLNSSNGTLVNGIRVEGKRVLEPGSILSIGSIVFRVDDSAAPGAGRPAGRAGDTAVAQSVGAPQEEELDFEIEVDSETQVISPGTAVRSATAATSPRSASTTPQPDLPEVATHASEPKELDEADVAGFLFDLDVDEDDKR
jgi:predicted component of type VI protein secretion system